MLIDSLGKKMLDISYNEEGYNTTKIFYIIGNRDFLDKISNELDTKYVLHTEHILDREESLNIKDGDIMVYINGLKVTFKELNTIPTLYYSNNKQWTSQDYDGMETYLEIIDGITVQIVKNEI